MKELILEHASKNSEFNKSLESLRKTYGTEDVSSEVIADISGQLLGNQEFINNLSIKEPSLFKKIYNKIKEIANKITGNSKESLFIKDLKNKWESAYRNTTNEQARNNIKDSKYSFNKNMVLTKGNIPINNELLNKYSSAREIFINESNNFNGEVSIKTDIKEIKNIDISSLNSKETKNLANMIFKKYNSKSVFENNGNKITVSKSGINESIEKIFNNKEQRNLLKEHLQVFSDLGDIIEHATLVNQTPETKNRENINSWNYYFDGLNINGELYLLEFDVRSLHNGQNQYRVQRLQKKQIAHSGDLSNITNDLPAFEQSVSTNNISQTNTKVNDTSSTKHSMQNNQNDAWQEYIEANFKPGVQEHL